MVISREDVCHQARPQEDPPGQAFVSFFALADFSNVFLTILLMILFYLSMHVSTLSHLFGKVVLFIKIILEKNLVSVRKIKFFPLKREDSHLIHVLGCIYRSLM